MNNVGFLIIVSLVVIFVSMGILFLRRNLISYLLAIYASSAGVSLGFVAASRTQASDYDDGLSFALAYIAVCLFSCVAALAVLYRRSASGDEVNKIDTEEQLR